MQCHFEIKWQGTSFDLCIEATFSHLLVVINTLQSFNKQFK